MKATLRNSFAKRSIVLAASALPSLYAGLANAQVPAPAPAPVVAPAPEPAPVVAPAPAPEMAPAVVTPPAPLVPPAPATVPAPMPADAPPATPAEAETYKHINMGVWMRMGGLVQNQVDKKKLNRFGGDGEVELHFSNQMRKYLAWTANFVATFDKTTGAGTGSVGVLDLIAQFEPDKAFNIWVGHMLVPSDRSNFSGPYFMAPWNYPSWGPKEGPFGRNNGMTIWGQAEGGMFKYYASMFNLNVPNSKILFSGRLNLSLLNPEPGYYNSSTYYGKDILAIGVGGQFQKHGDVGTPTAPLAPADYGLFNADVLFEKDLAGSGVLDLEGALYKYVGDNQSAKFSHFLLGSYLTPDTGIGKFQPLVRVQQSIPKAGDTTTMIDAQVGYVVDSYSTRLALGYSHTGGSATIESNSVFAGLQLQK